MNFITTTEFNEITHMASRIFDMANIRGCRISEEQRCSESINLINKVSGQRSGKISGMIVKKSYNCGSRKWARWIHYLELIPCSSINITPCKINGYNKEK